MWIPVLMVASLLFWTLALALGGMSLMAANKISLFDAHCRFASPEVSADIDVDGAGSHSGYDPIVVHIEESGDPDDVDDQATTAAADDPDSAAQTSSQPGQTAF
jgi:hypothetical protein